MFLSIFLSFVLSRKFRGRSYALLTILITVVVSFFSASGWEEVIVFNSDYYFTPTFPIPLSFPFYASIDISMGFISPPGSPPMYGEYQFYFLTVEIGRFVFPLRSALFLLVYSFFVLVNLIGGIVGYWMGKSVILERFFGRARMKKELSC
jgi:hypothetical protein